MKAQPDTLLCVGGDPWDEPRGGQTTFAKHLLAAFPGRFAVVGTCDEALPAGQWSSRPFSGTAVPFFNLGPLDRPLARKPFVPARLQVYVKALRYLGTVHRSGPWNILVDCPELLLPAARYRWRSVCYSFAGVNNPVACSRYVVLRHGARLVENCMAKALRKIAPEVLIAAADDRAIQEMLKRVDSSGWGDRIVSFPTRVDTRKFYPEDQAVARTQVGLPAAGIVLAAVGRLCWVKGWDLLLDVVRLLSGSLPDVRLVFVGDGEDRAKLLERADRLGIGNRVIVTGFLPQERVRTFVNAADLCVVGSHHEGWSVAMLEMLACGKPMVATDVSGARDQIVEGGNGYIVASRDPAVYAAAVQKALNLANASQVSLQIAMRFSVERLAAELRPLWTPLRIPA
jgi:glycosyltransferase involved in cell wall biosynthesis